MKGMTQASLVAVNGAEMMVVIIFPSKEGEGCIEGRQMQWRKVSIYGLELQRKRVKICLFLEATVKDGGKHAYLYFIHVNYYISSL